MRRVKKRLWRQTKLLPGLFLHHTLLTTHDTHTHTLHHMYSGHTHITQNILCTTDTHATHTDHTHHIHTPHTHVHTLQSSPSGWSTSAKHPGHLFPILMEAGDSANVKRGCLSPKWKLTQLVEEQFPSEQELVDPPSLLRTQPGKKIPVLNVATYKSLLFESWTGRKRIKESN